MRAGVKFVATAIAVCLMVGVLMVGIFAASSGNMLLTSMVQWQSVGVEMDLHGKVFGNSSSDGNDTNYEDSLTLANDSKSSTWAIGTLSFVVEDDLTASVRKSKPITMRFGFTNTSTHNVNVYYYFASAPNEISNVTYEYQLAYGTLGSGETWESNFFSDSYSGNMNVTGASDKYYSVQRCTDRSYIAPGESAVFEIRMTVTILTQNVSTATLSPILKFQNTPMEAGTINNPYIISEEEDYAYYATSAYMGNSNMYFLQTNDLAFNSVSTAQSVSAPREADVRANTALPVINLLGHYDGGGNTIDLTGTNSPLFNNVGSTTNSTASLSNLNVYNENSTGNCGVVTNVYGTLDEITFDGKIEPSSDYAGGIAIYNIGRIQNSINYADIVVTEDGSLVGGIAIWTERSATYSCVYFDNCINYGDFSGSIHNGGGIVCSGDSAEFYMTNCINVGNVISDSTYAGIGGLVGSVGGENNYYLESCYNSGSISAETTAATSHNVAGIIPGSFGPGVSVSITNCYNLGQVSAEGTAKIYAVSPSDTNVTISNCYYLSTCGAAGAGTAISLYESQNIETWSGFDFDSTWEFASAKIMIDGKERTLYLPRLSFEKLEYGQPEVIEPDSPGGGGSDGSYTIASAADFVKYATETSATGIGFANPDISFKQTANITLTSSTFVTSTLLADYDGGNYTLNLDPTSEASNIIEPLFTGIGSSTATSINTNLKNLTVKYSSSAMLGYSVAGFARNIYYTRVENVHAVPDVPGSSQITLAQSDSSIAPKNLGAIAYKSDHSEFINCSNAVSTTFTGTYWGGIVGNAQYSEFVGCWNEYNGTSATSWGAYLAGGIAGYALNCDFNYCWNNADVTVTVPGVTIGGIVGNANGSTTIKNCYNTGDMSTTLTGGFLAGIVGNFSGRDTAFPIENCYNTGNITANTDTVTGAIAIYIGCSPVGAASTWNATVKNCYNTGSVKSFIHNVGTANTGYATNLTFLNCYDYTPAFSWYISNTGLSGNTTITTSKCFTLTSTASSTMQTKSTYTNAGWTFGTYGTATDGWVWRSASIVANGGTFTYSLPRLWYEGLSSSVVIGMLGSSSSGGNTDEPEVETYTIASASDFNKYAAVTSTTGIGFANPNIAFKQTADITSSALTTANLAATYDGGNYTINTTGVSKAVFATITGTLKNLTVRNTSYTPGENLSNQYDCSGVAETLSGGTMKNVHFTGTVSASGTSAYFGGLLEILDTGTIDGCSNSATITINLGTSGVWAKAGGLVQTAWGGTIKNSWNTGAITAVAWGYEGSPASGGCYYNGYAGGFIADGSVQAMQNCYNTGSISANGYVGGFIGAGSAQFTNCYNTGWITSAGFSPSGGYTVYPQSATFGEGGFIGSAFNTSFTNCFAAGVATGKLSGAFVGRSESASGITESGCYRLTSTKYTVPTDSYVSYTSRSHGSSGTAHTQSNWSWTFGTAGTATDGWVWVTDEIVINGEELTYALPRLWFEESSSDGSSAQCVACGGDGTCTGYNVSRYTNPLQTPQSCPSCKNSTIYIFEMRCGCGVTAGGGGDCSNCSYASPETVATHQCGMCDGTGAVGGGGG